MAYIDEKFTYDSLGKIIDGSLKTALFPQIRDAIIERMMDIYGNDIDISSASADGQYVNMEALVLNNIYRLLDNLYNNINPSSAYGQYLDILCSLSNIERKNPTYSTAQLYVKYVGSGTSYVPDSITLIDKTQHTWKWVNPLNSLGTGTVAFNTNDIKVLEFTCDNIGAIEAYGTGVTITDPAQDIPWNDSNFESINGSINRPISDIDFKVYQNADAILGNMDEPDSSLRNRRLNFVGGNSSTIQSGLEAALYNLESIKDVYILNNASGSSITANDSTSVGAHNIYIVLRYKEGLPDDVDKIGGIIYNKLNPGIVTQSFTGTSSTGAAKSKSLNLVAGNTITISWKRATPIKPKITIRFKKITNRYNAAIQQAAIIEGLQNYFTNIKLNENVLCSTISSEFGDCDTKPNGQMSFYPLSTKITVGGTDYTSNYQTPLTYYKYSNSDFVFTTDVSDSTIGILTIN